MTPLRLVLLSFFVGCDGCEQAQDESGLPGESALPTDSSDTPGDSETSDTAPPGVFNLDGITLEPDPVHAKSTAVLQAEGEIPEGVALAWSSSEGELVGEGWRLNLTPSIEGEVDVHVVGNHGDVELSETTTFTVLAPRPRLYLEVVERLEERDGGWALWSVQGRATDLPVEACELQVGFFVHTDVFYAVEPWKGSGLLGEDGSFELELRLHEDADRLVGLLADADFDLPGACESCAGVYDSIWRHHVPLDPDGEDVHAFGTHHFLGDAEHDDPLIRNLLGRFSSAELGSEAEPARLVRSYLDMDQLYTYDQALAVIAFSHAGEREAAESVLRAMRTVQHESGAWYFSYDFDGTSIYPMEKGDRRVSGAIAWMAMALAHHRAVFGSSEFEDMALATLDYLDALRIELEIDGTTHRPVPFGPSDLDTTVWDETAVVAVEHNLDAYAAFRDHAVLTGDSAWQERADELRAFLEACWRGDHFVPGWTAGVGPNEEELYLDTQTWGVLALGSEGSAGEDYAAGLQRDCDLFQEGAGYIDYRAAGVSGFFDWVNGVSLEPAHRFVWTEGTLGMALALDEAGDAGVCEGVSSESLRASMNTLLDGDGGLPYATQTANTDFTTSSSIAGTAWLYFAQEGVNPFRAAPE